jgi:hypothetical protein
MKDDDYGVLNAILSIGEPLKMRHAATTVMAAATMTSSLVFAQPTAPPAMQSGSPQAGEEARHMISRPTTPIEYARNLKFIFDHDLLLQDQFYAEANLKDVFNLEEVSIINERNVAKRDFLILERLPISIFPRMESSDYVDGLTPAADFVGGKRGGADGTVTAGINFYMGESGPSFDETWRIFGEKFVRLDPMPHPHGSPPAAKAPHGNESWRYQLSGENAEKMVTLSFNPAGQLGRINLEVRKQ